MAAPTPPPGFQLVEATPTPPPGFALMTEAPAAPEPSFLDRAQRIAGLAGRAAITGITGIPTLMAEPVAAALRYATGGKYFPSPSATLQNNMTAAGLPAPETAPERIGVNVGAALSGQLPMLKLGDLMAQSAGPVMSRVGDLLRSQPGMQGVGAGSGALASTVASEAGAGPVGQTIAGLVGGAVPGLTAAIAPGTVRHLLRGGEEGRQRVADNIRLFEESGYGSPSVGQASEGRLARAIESGAAKTPGGAGRMAEKAESGTEGLGSRVNELADALSPRATSTKAGVAIERGVRDFVDQFRGEQKFLYDKLDAYLPGTQKVSVGNLLSKLDEITQVIPGAESVSKGALGNPTVQAIKDQIARDTRDGLMPYSAVKGLRTRIGEKIADAGLTSDIGRTQLKQIYGALSEDMGAAARSAGPEAERAFSRANTYTRAGHDRIETYLDRVAGKDTVEKVFQAAVNPSEIREGASTVNAVIRSLDPDARNTVRAAFLKRLGNATPGKQDAGGETFSTETYLTNWNKISPEAKMTLFADQSGTLRKDLDKIAQVAGNIREGSKVFANPSGTQQAISSQVAGGGALVALITGNAPVAAGIAGAATIANATSRLMTNPAFVKWLARNTDAPTSIIPAELNTLAGMAQKMSAEDRQAVTQFIEIARKEAGTRR